MESASSGGSADLALLALKSGNIGFNLFLVKEFFDREVAFDEMLTDIYKTIGDGVKNIIG